VCNAVRKEWLENRLEELAEIFAVAVGGFAVMHNHLHVLVRLDPKVAQGWSDLEVVQRWGRLFPPRDKFRQLIPVTDQHVEGHTAAEMVTNQLDEAVLFMNYESGPCRFCRAGVAELLQQGQTSRLGDFAVSALIRNSRGFRGGAAPVLRPRCGDRPGFAADDRGRRGQRRLD
jgi:hypothetical protein